MGRPIVDSGIKGSRCRKPHCSRLNLKLESPAVIGENRQLLTDGPVEFEK